MKAFSITAFFPEVKAHLAWQSTTIRARDFHVAASRGLKQIRGMAGIAGKHITEVRLTIKAEK